MSTLICLWCHSIVVEILNLKLYVTVYVTFLWPLSCRGYRRWWECYGLILPSQKTHFFSIFGS